MPIQLENEAASAIDATDLVIVRRGASTYTIDGVLIGDILDRTNHTGTQTSATISDFDAAVDARIALGPSGATDLTWTAATRTIASSSGADAVITLADGSNAGLLSSADFTKLSGISGTNTGDQTITLTGDVTGSGTGSFAATIANGAVTYAKMQATALGNVVIAKSGAAGTLTEVQLGLNNLLGRGSSGNLTTITVDSTLTFAGSALGVTPGTYADASHSHSDAVASGASGFMTGADKAKLDGIASGATANTGDVVGPGSSTDNALVRMDGGTGKAVQNSGVTLDDNGVMTFPVAATPSAPAAGTMAIFVRDLAGRLLPAIIGPAGFPTALQPHFGRNAIAFARPRGNSTTLDQQGLTSTGTGTATAASVAQTNVHTEFKRIEYTATASATAVAGWRSASNQFSVGGAGAGRGGFHIMMRWGPGAGATVATHRAFCGMRVNAAPTDVEPSSLTNIVGMGWDAADTNVQFMHNDGSGTATKIDLGASFPVPTADRTDAYEIAMFALPGTTQSLTYLVTNLTAGATATGTITTDLPATSTLLAPALYFSVGGTSSAISVALMNVYIETDY